MPATMKTRAIALVSLAALLVAAGVAVAGDGDREGRREKRGRKGRLALLEKEKRGRAMKARHRALERIASLSDEQARAALEASKDLARIREEARAKAAAILLDARSRAKAGGKDAAPEARKALREETRGKMAALREGLRAPMGEAGMKVVRSLTPEQRAKIEEHAKSKGRTVDEGRLALRFGHRLSRPWARALLRARVDGAGVEKGPATPTVPAPAPAPDAK
jgi:hypothetical protein